MSEQRAQPNAISVDEQSPSYDDDSDGFRTNYFAPLSQTHETYSRLAADQIGSPDQEYSSGTSLGQRSNDQFSGLSQPSEIIDQSRSHDAEKVVEVSPNKRYMRLNTLLGKGAYKVVYKAIDREEGYEVAWNTMQATRSPINKEMEHEIEILKSVRHPNVIAFHDAWSQKNEFVFITELMTSGTLREYIRKLSLPNIKIVKRWSRQILKGLAYLHGYEPSIIHRDIKCDNIFINGAHGEVKIGDMGTAEMKTGKKYTVIGTPEFMAPEMYEEKGYSEKVDIYAFGMCLLEMATGEYPYGECKNAAQIYKKVSSGEKPDCLRQLQQETQNRDMLTVIENCLGPEEERMLAEEILEHPFLAVEPDVVLLAADAGHAHLTLQVVFKGIDKLSVKFDFNVATDTAEQVVREMIEEQVLPERYQHHITKEINRILRDIEKPSEAEQEELAKQSVWRRENDIRSELERTRKELGQATNHVHDVESKCEEYERQAREAENKYQDIRRRAGESLPGNGSSSDDLKVDMATTSATKNDKEQEPKTAPPPTTAESEAPARKSEDTLSPSAREVLFAPIFDEYSDDTEIGVFVKDCANAAHRSPEKAHEWTRKLMSQDIVTVGDLRDLHDEDWSGIGLTVFALRALKNMLKGERLAGQSLNTSLSTTTPMTPSAPSSARLSPPH